MGRDEDERYPGVGLLELLKNGESVAVREAPVQDQSFRIVALEAIGDGVAAGFDLVDGDTLGREIAAYAEADVRVVLDHQDPRHRLVAGHAKRSSPDHQRLPPMPGLSASTTPPAGEFCAVISPPCWSAMRCAFARFQTVPLPC